MSLGRVLTGATLTAALLSGGLVLTGHAARARALLAPRGRLLAAPGSHEVGVETIWVDGRPATVRSCYAPGSTPAAVLARYRAVAEADTPEGLPYVISSDDEGGQLLWTTGDGTRLAAHVLADPRGGAFYQLFEEAPPGLTDRAPVGLPLDVALPDGVELVFSVRRADGSGTALLAAAGEPRGVAARFAAPLEARGLLLDREWAGVADEEGPLALPLRGARHRGVLTVTPDDSGVATRVLLAIERSRGEDGR